MVYLLMMKLSCMPLVTWKAHSQQGIHTTLLQYNNFYFLVDVGLIRWHFVCRMIPQCQHNLRSIMMEVIKTDENLAKVEKFLQQQVLCSIRFFCIVGI